MLLGLSQYQHHTPQVSVYTNTINYSWFARDVTAFPVLRIRHVGVQQHAELHMP